MKKTSLAQLDPRSLRSNVFEVSLDPASEALQPPEVQDCVSEFVVNFSGRLCTKSQLITLKDEGYWDQLMDDGRPTIVVKDW